ncbi:1343_t:CDS:2 [Funneliformis caledonium]|uniref:1343_t:CDS:1 n=1 Tax=Funneliformis caledonium TaxID=1117310 RepID=A0A9N9EDZ0_9GLOM|nr:1343_t:CDS:2 [Funneliformis caledonium]
MELDTLITRCEKDLITFIWKVKQYNANKINVVLLKNRTHMCSCYAQYPEAFFYIKLIPIRWSKEKYLQIEQNLIAVNEPFISQSNCIVETNPIVNNIIFQIRDDLDDNDQKEKVKARRVKDIYGKFSGIFKEALKKAIDDEDFSLYNTINQWIIDKQLSQQMNNEGLFQFHYDNDDQNSIENILPPEFKKRKGPTANKRIKSSVEGNKRKTAESKTLKRKGPDQYLLHLDDGDEDSLELRMVSRSKDTFITTLL